MRLNEFQQQFKDLMLDHPDALQTPPEALADFCMSGDIPLPERLSVYRNNIVGSLTDVMRSSFPVLEALVGQEFLEGMARAFILKNPPARGCLNFYGAGFAEFIEGFAPAKSLPYLPDIARFELALGQSYYADEDRAMAAEELGTIAPDDLGALQLFLRESVRLISSPYPLVALRDYCLAGANGQPPALDQGGATIMVYRPDYNVEVIETQVDEHLMLSTLQTGQALGTSVEAVLAHHPEFDFGAFLQKHIARETFLPLATNE
jgi:hypothetical protein